MTGGGRGIGETIARRLAHEGFHVVVADIDPGAASRVVETIRGAGGHADFFTADVGSEADLRALFAWVDATFPNVRLLVNNAGIALDDVYPAAPYPAWRRVIDTNLVGTMLATQCAFERMRGRAGGLILNMSSSAGLGYGPHGDPAYAATKAAIARLTATLVGLASEGVRVNAICPGWVATPKVKAYLSSLTPEERRSAAPARLIEPEELAELVMMFWHTPSAAGRVVVWQDGRPWRFAGDGPQDPPSPPSWQTVGVAAIVHDSGRVLLERRAVEPGCGLWALPGGMVEHGEELEAACVREVLEETSLSVRIRKLLGLRGGRRVCIAFYEADVLGGVIAKSAESLELAWFALPDIPWDAMAFDRHRAVLHEWAQSHVE